MKAAIQVIQHEGLIRSIALPPDFTPSPASADADSDLFRFWYSSWFSGCPGPVSPEWFDWSELSVFQSSILQALQKVPFGKVLSYKQLAVLAGHPRSIRAVASVLALNPFPLVYPCHRVIYSDLRCGVYSRIPDNPVKKRILLREGVVFTTEDLVSSVSVWDGVDGR